jgi:hypothetical protein
MARPFTPLPLLLAALATVITALAVPPDASGAMRSTKLAPGLCKTVGGGKFVDIPGFPGERIDRRLLRDIRWMRRKYSIFITDGYSTAPYHAPNGEHPIGLALDIVPHRARGGTWKKITRLAKFAEPRQNQPRPPWRWVGYEGDAGHGRGHHLHLSYMHSPTPPRVPARVVYTYRCPKRPAPKPEEPAPEPEPTDPAPSPPPSGGTASPSGTAGSGSKTGSGSSPTGGVASPKSLRFGLSTFGPLAPVVVEVAGTDLARVR